MLVPLGGVCLGPAVTVLRQRPQQHSIHCFTCRPHNTECMIQCLACACSLTQLLLWVAAHRLGSVLQAWPPGGRSCCTAALAFGYVVTVFVCSSAGLHVRCTSQGGASMWADRTCCALLQAQLRDCGLLLTVFRGLPCVPPHGEQDLRALHCQNVVMAGRGANLQDAEAVLLIRRKIVASSVPPSGVLHSIPARMQLLLPQCAKAGRSQFDLCSWRAAAACIQQNPPYIYRRLYCWTV